MESKSRGPHSTNRELAKYYHGTPFDRVQVKPAALLLTTAPLECLKAELGRINVLGPHFYAITIGVFRDLSTDRHAVNLREVLGNFSRAMWAASYEIHFIFNLSQCFYVHSLDEIEGSGKNPGPITQARVARLLEPDFQTKVLRRARLVASRAAKASKAVQEQALPLLPQLEKELDAYVVDYVTRTTLMDKRKKSWIPLALQDALWGAIEPTPGTTSEVQSFPGRLSIVIHFLHQISTFLDNLELHFRRLSEVDSQQMLEHGYSTTDNFTRLFQDRILCQYIVEDIGLGWTTPSLAFAHGAAYD